MENSAYDNYAEIGKTETDQRRSIPNISIEIPFNQSPRFEKSKHEGKSPSNHLNMSQNSPVRLKVPANENGKSVPPWDYIPFQKAPKNIIRRSSYDLAIGRYTVLCNKYGGEPVTKYGGELVTNGKIINSQIVAYENSAYDCESSFL